MGPEQEGADPEQEALAPISGESGKEPVLTDAEIARRGKVVDLEGKQTEVERLRAEVESLREGLDTERENRGLRQRIAIPALIVMLLQVVTSNAIFIWYGDTNAWNISAGAISAWMGTTVVEVVGVVLVIVNYLFPNTTKRDG